MMNAEDRELITRARAVRDRAYAPYSGFSVGVALRTASGRVVVGCNVESVTYGLTLCAERVAFASLHTDEPERIASIAVVVPEGQRAVPCGICRQLFREFAPGARLLLVTPDGVDVRTVEALLPSPGEDGS